MELLKPLQKTIRVEKGICGEVGEWAVGAWKTETCKPEHDYRTIKQQRSIKLRYDTVQYSWIQQFWCAFQPTSPKHSSSAFLYSWRCDVHVSLRTPPSPSYICHLSFDKGQKDTRKMLRTSTVCPLSLGESSSWGWDRKSCREEGHDTLAFPKASSPVCSQVPHSQPAPTSDRGVREQEREFISPRPKLCIWVQWWPSLSYTHSPTLSASHWHAFHREGVAASLARGAGSVPWAHPTGCTPLLHSCQRAFWSSPKDSLC